MYEEVIIECYMKKLWKQLIKKDEKDNSFLRFVVDLCCGSFGVLGVSLANFLVPLCRSEDYNDRMEQRERDKKSRQILTQQSLSQDIEEELPLFNAPIRVAQSDDRIQRQLGMFDLAKSLMDKYIGVQGPSQLRPAIHSLQPPYGHMNAVGGVGGGGGNYGTSNREGYSNARSHVMGSSSSGGQSVQTSSVSSAGPPPAAAFLKPKEAPPNGLSRYGGGGGVAHGNRPMMHEVSLGLVV